MSETNVFIQMYQDLIDANKELVKKYLTARQQYKVAALEGILSADSTNQVPAEMAVHWAADIADRMINEDLEYEKRNI
jgi:tyrosyl-tRNA synthetase